MYEVAFSDQSMAELNNLGMQEQMQFVETISSITSEQLIEPTEPLGRFQRGGKTYYRLRAGDFRCYFEIRNSVLYSHFILHKNTFNDFVFRNKLPINEGTLAEEHSSFWNYLESMARKPERKD